MTVLTMMAHFCLGPRAFSPVKRDGGHSQQKGLKGQGLQGEASVGGQEIQVRNPSSNFERRRDPGHASRGVCDQVKFLSLLLV